MGAMPAEGIYLLVARVATGYYFVHFLIILPILGYKEKTLDIPLSITDPILENSTNQSLAKEQINKK
jgi:ubiquinol-cytochrome c reductase cytochrome b subunit